MSRPLLACLAAVAALTAGCADDPPLRPPLAPGATDAYVLTSDYVSGALAVLDLATRAVVHDVVPVHADATLRVHDGRIFVVNRFGQDNIQVIDPAAGFVTVRQFSTGNGSNPQDIVVVSADKAYVSRYNSSELLIVNPLTGVVRGTIALGAYADGDGLPEMAQMVRVGRRLFVACQRLTNFSPVLPGAVVVIDVNTDEIVDADPARPGRQAIALRGRNPITDLVHDAAANRLLVGCAGGFGAADGGIEAIDLAGLTSLGFVIDEAELGGDVLDVVLDPAGHAYAIVSDAEFNAALVSWDRAAGRRLAVLHAPGGFSLADAEINGRRELIVCDNGFRRPGLYVFAAGADTLVAGPLDTGLPPVRIAFE